MAGSEAVEKALDKCTLASYSNLNQNGESRFAGGCAETEEKGRSTWSMK